MQNEMKLHVLFHWFLFRKEKKRLSLQGPVGNRHLGARTQVLPLPPTERENTPPADFQLVREFFLPLSLPFAATELCSHPIPSLKRTRRHPLHPTRSHVRYPGRDSFLLKREA